MKTHLCMLAAALLAGCDQPAQPTSPGTALPTTAAQATAPEPAPAASNSPAVPSAPSEATKADRPVPPPVPPPTPPAAPSAVDLRPQLLAMGLSPRPQGGRGTCSVFTTCVALEFALAKQRGSGSAPSAVARMSPEYLNWAGAKVIGRPSDGNFFHNALKGWEDLGLCTEAAMPYAEKYDAARQPSSQASEEAARVRERAKGAIAVHWIVPWVPDRFGVDDAQFAEVKRVLASGYPVAAGSGHSRLLVGYRDDAAAAGGGNFVTLDSALNRFDEVTYAFVKKDVADVFWVECVEK